MLWIILPVNFMRYPPSLSIEMCIFDLEEVITLCFLLEFILTLVGIIV